MARHLEAAFPEIERAVQIFNRIMWVHTNERGFKARTCIANSSILDVFTFPILKGDPTSLNRHGTAFITAAFAQQLFGSQDPIGRTVSVDYKWVKGDFEITGILADIPANNDPKLRFDLLTSTYPEGRYNQLIWSQGKWGMLSTHLLVRPGTNLDNLLEKLRVLAKNRSGESDHVRHDYHLQPTSNASVYDPGLRSADEWSHGKDIESIRRAVDRFSGARPGVPQLH